MQSIHCSIEPQNQMVTTVSALCECEEHIFYAEVCFSKGELTKLKSLCCVLCDLVKAAFLASAVSI